MINEKYKTLEVPTLIYSFATSKTYFVNKIFQTFEINFMNKIMLHFALI